MKLHLPIFYMLACTAIAAAEWQSISDSVTAQVKPGYAGPTAGVTVDPATGAVFMVVNDQGLWRSTDHGETFARCDGGVIGGRCETGYALQFDPAGHRLACFMIYGSSGMTSDGGSTWTKFQTTHLDFGAVDWSDTGKRLLAIRHESGGQLIASVDAGATWVDLDKGFSGCGVVDHSVFVATKLMEPGIFRSGDAGASWTKVSELKPTAAVPFLLHGALYWPGGQSIMVSTDAGKTWSALPTTVDATFGPFPGQDANHLVVVGNKGFSETLDRGQTWKLTAALPTGFTVGRVGPHYAWDARANIFYASSMTKPTLKWTRE